MSIISGLKIAKGSEWLRPVFTKMRGVVETLNEWNKEPCYWNNETASVSLLISAAAKARFFGVADYRRYKRKSGQDSNGRCDLLIGTDTNWLEIEAKQIYVGPKTRTARSALQNACADAKTLWGCSRRAGLLFVVASLSKSRALTIDCRVFQEAAYDLYEKSKASLLWYWYDNNAKDSFYRSTVTDRQYPGFAIVLKKF